MAQNYFITLTSLALSVEIEFSPRVFICRVLIYEAHSRPIGGFISTSLLLCAPDLGAKPDTQCQCREV